MTACPDDADNAEHRLSVLLDVGAGTDPADIAEALGIDPDDIARWICTPEPPREDHQMTPTPPSHL